MSDYGLNFAFRRSEPAVEEGRLLVPAAGAFYIGDLVTVDPAVAQSMGRNTIKAAEAGALFEPGYTGFLIQEEGWDLSVYGAPVLDSYGKGKALNGKPCTVVAGAGLKVALKNTPTGTTSWDGRALPGRTIVTIAGLVVGDVLAWNPVGSVWAKAAAGQEAVTGALRVTQVGTDFVEAVVR